MPRPPIFVINISLLLWPINISYHMDILHASSLGGVLLNFGILGHGALTVASGGHSPKNAKNKYKCQVNLA